MSSSHNSLYLDDRLTPAGVEKLLTLPQRPVPCAKEAPQEVALARTAYYIANAIEQLIEHAAGGGAEGFMTDEQAGALGMEMAQACERFTKTLAALVQHKGICHGKRN